jgi:hypothetical protein
MNSAIPPTTVDGIQQSLHLFLKGYKPTAEFRVPRCGGGICEVNMESRLLYFSQALKTKLELAVTFQNQNG